MVIQEIRNFILPCLKARQSELDSYWPVGGPWQAT
jgi:hypothetical protein